MELVEAMDEYNETPTEKGEQRIKQLKNTKEQLNTRLLALEHKVLSSQDRKCSDHAIVRYFQRILGMDILQLEKNILDDDRAEKIRTNGIVVTIQIPKKRGEK